MTHAEDLGFRGDRVRQSTTRAVNRDVTQTMQDRVQHFAATRDPEEIEARIEELNHEWDIERVLELNAAAISLVSLSLGLRHSRKWFGLQGLVLAFLAQHAIQGWCPPVPFLRRLGFRTQREIEAEKYALKALQKEGLNSSS